MGKFEGLGFNTTKAIDLYTRAKNPNSRALQKNQALFVMYFNYLLDMNNGRFKWEGLPEELEEHKWFIENTLALHSVCILFKEPITGKFLFLPATPLGGPTMYGDYNEYLALGVNGQSFNVKREDCVVFWDTLGRNNSTIIELTEFANRIGEIQRTKDVRLINHKKPLIFTGTQNNVENANAFTSRMNENEVAIVIDDASPILTPIKNEITFLNNELEKSKQELINEFLQMQGINTNPEDGKKQRMLVDEVNSNNEKIIAARMSYLEPRVRACEEANEKWGLNLKCYYHGEEKEQEQIPKPEEKEVI